MPVYNDARWPTAQSFGKLGNTPPWDRAKEVSADQPGKHERFRINREFRIHRVTAGERTGSLIAMTFNEFGHIIAAEENGGLIMIADTNNDQVPDTVRPFCDEVKNCQGILALNGDVFVTGMGPEGNALYRLSDSDRNGKIDKVKKIIGFTGKAGEHGPGQIELDHA